MKYDKINNIKNQIMYKKVFAFFILVSLISSSVYAKEEIVTIRDTIVAGVGQDATVEIGEYIIHADATGKNIFEYCNFSNDDNICEVKAIVKNINGINFITKIISAKPISQATPDTNTAQQTAPVVFGLYLGMSYDNAVQKLTNEGYEIKYFKIHESHRKNSLTPIPYTYNIFKNGTEIGWFSTLNERGVISTFALSPAIFGVKDYDQFNFAKQFLDHYKIPYSQDMFSITKGEQLVLTNRQDGYEISFPNSGFGYSTVIMKEIQKNSDIQFK